MTLPTVLSNFSNDGVIILGPGTWSNFAVTLMNYARPLTISGSAGTFITAVAGGAFTYSNPAANASLTLIGLNITRGNGACAVVATNANITIIGGYVTGFTTQAPVVIGYGNLVVVGTTFSNNVSPIVSAAIVASSAVSVVIKDSTFLNCTGYSGGAKGAIHVSGASPSTLQISGCVFRQVASLNDGGGAIYSNGVATTVANCAFTGATAYGLGGAVLVETGSVQILNTQFRDCSSTLFGGGAFSTSAPATIINATFVNVFGFAQGGAILATTTSLQIANSTFRNASCGAGCAGGAISFASGSLTLTNVIFDTTNASHGGAVYTQNDVVSMNMSGVYAVNNIGSAFFLTQLTGPIRFTNSTFVNNTGPPTGVLGGPGGIMSLADNLALYYCNFEANSHGGDNYPPADGGGAFHLKTIGTTVVVVGSRFVNNDAKAYAGGVAYLRAAVFALWQDCTFIANTGSSGGAIQMSGWGNFVINGSNVFQSNVATGHGGAIDIGSGSFSLEGLGYYSTLNITGAYFANNTILGSVGGSAVHCSFYTITTVANSTFVGNIATTGRGVFSFERRLDIVYPTLSIFNSTFLYNSAATLGGAVAWDLGTGKLQLCGVNFTGNTAGNGAAVYADFQTGNLPFTISGCTFTNNVALSGSSAIGVNDTYYAPAPLTLVNCVFTGNIANSTGASTVIANIWSMTNCVFRDNINGGATVFSTGAPVPVQFPIVGCTFINNTAGYSPGLILGGALYVDNPAPITLKNVVFAGNTNLNGTGGAVTGAVYSIVNSNFTRNSAVLAGGAIFSTITAPVIVSNSTFCGNTATLGDFSNPNVTEPNVGSIKDGGALYVPPGVNVRVNNSIFTSNTAFWGSGGAISGDVSSVVNSIFSGNSAYKNGGAISSSLLSQASTILFANSSFTANAACNTGTMTSRGGAVLVQNTSTIVTLQSVVFSGNNCTSGDGAGIAASIISVTNSTFTNNMCPCRGNGGAIYNYLPLNVVMTVRDSTFAGGFTINAGAGILSNGGVNVTNCLFAFNRASSNGGGAIWAKTATVTGSTFLSNKAVGNGGAIRLQSSTNPNDALVVNNCSFSANQASFEGGAIYAASLNITLTGSTFDTNAAPSGGGALCGVNGMFITIASCSFTRNGAFDNTNGIIYLYSPCVWILTLVNSRFVGSKTSGGGAALSVLSLGPGVSTIANCTFVGNIAGGNGGQGGGAVVLNSGPTDPSTVVTTNTSFLNNAYLGSIYAGGGALAVYARWFNQSGCTYISNNSSAIGGAIFAQDFYMTDVGSIYVNNVAQMQGAAIANSPALTYSNRFFSGVTFRANRAMHEGGAFWATTPDTSDQHIFVNCSFDSNVASAGGAIYASAFSGSSYTLTLNCTTVINNTALSADGGGVYAYTLYTANTSYAMNRAGSAGSGGAVKALNSITAVGVNFNANVAGLDGGAVALFDSGVLMLLGANVTNNAAGRYGGGVYGGILTKQTLTNSEFVNNTAVRGGGVYADYIANGPYVSGCSFTSNNATDLGGGFYIAEANFDHATSFSLGADNTQTVFEYNVAGTMGGGIYAAGLVLLSQVLLNSNYAPTGGALAAFDAVTIKAQTVFTQNSASVTAAAIYCSGCSLDLSVTSFNLNVAPTFPVLSCIVGSHMLYATGSNTISPSNLATLGNQLMADCTQCGCCDVGPHVTFQQACFPYPGNSNCTAVCDTGYAKTSNQFFCDLNRNIVPGPACYPLTCSNVTLVTPGNGSIDPSSVYATPLPVTGDVIKYRCNGGYTLVGNTTNTCLGPEWNSTTPICEPKLCPLGTDQVRYGGVLNAGTYHTGDVVTVFCDPGYMLDSGFPSVTCLGIGFNPSLHDVPCNPMTCPPLEVPLAPLTVYISDNKTAGVAVYDCGTTRYVLGDSKRTCNGTAWSGVEPICVPLPCNRIDPVANGTVVYHFHYNNTDIPVTDDTAECFCDAGFALQGYRQSGDNLRKCSAPSFDAPCTCTLTACPIAAATYLNTTDVVAVNETVGLECAPGAAGSRPGISKCVQAGVNVQAAFVPALIICEQCPSNQFSPGGDSLNCQVCPNGGTTTAAGATERSNCTCIEGFYELTPGEGDCTKCPVGADCPGGHERPRAARNYWKVEDQYVACTPAEACAGNNTCTEGYDGLYCGACIPRYYRLNGRCLSCPADIGWRLFAVILVGLALAYGLVLIVRPSDISERSYGFASGTIALSFIQIVATFADLNVHWPVQTRQVFDVFSTLNLNLELAGPECFATFTFWQKFQLQMSVPLIVIGLLVFLWFAWTLVVWLKQKRPPISVIRRKAIEIAKISAGAYLFFLTLAYLLLAKATLAVFACKKRAGGAVTLASAPTESCIDPPWQDNAIIGGFGIAFYIVGIPIFVHLVYMVVRRQFGPLVATRSLYSNFLVKRYRKNRWFWEGITMLRKLAVVIVTTLFDGDAFIQTALCSAVFFLSCLATLVYRPYRWSKHNALEIISLVGSLIVLFCGQMSGSPQYGPKQQEGLGIIAIITVAICMLLFGACFALETGIFFTISKLAKRLNMAGGVIKCPSATSQPVGVMLQGDRVVVSGTDGLLLGLNAKDMVLSLSMPLGHKALATAAYGPTHVAAVIDNMLEVWDTNSRQAALMAQLPAAVTCLDASARGVVVGCTDGHLAFCLFKSPPLVSEAPRKDSIAIVSDEEMASILGDDDDDIPNMDATTNSMPSMASVGATGSTKRKRGATIMDPTMDPRKSSKRNMAALIEDMLIVEAHEGGVAAVCVASAFAFSVGQDWRARKWSVKDGLPVREWAITNASNSAAPTTMVENGSHLFIGDTTGTVHVIDLVTNEVVEQMRGHTGEIAGLHVTLTETGFVLITASLDGSVLLWDAEALTYLQMISKQAKPVVAVTASRDGKQIFWATKLGVLFTTQIQPEWHMHDFDPHLATLVWNKFIRRVKGALSPGNDADKTLKPYEELHLISSDLGVTRGEVPTDLAANNASSSVQDSPDMWARLRPESAVAVARALQAQSLARDGKNL